MKSRGRLIFLLIVGIVVLGFVKHQVDLMKSGDRGKGDTSQALSEKARELVTYRPLDGVDTVTLPSGLQYQDIKVGTGREPRLGRKVIVNYSGWRENTTLFDSSYLPGNKPLEFRLGGGEVIKGWEEGLVGMKTRGKRRLIIPPELAYGRDGLPPRIGPNATLIFDIELVKAR